MDDRDDSDDFAKLRLRRAGMREADRDLSGGGMPAFVGEVVSTAPNIAVGKFLKVRRIHALGRETEGGVGDFTAEPGDPVPVYLVGSSMPGTGERLICRFVDHRWVAERSRTGGGQIDFGTIPSCFCTKIPAALSMVSADPACNFGMFQSCAIQYGPTPSQFAPLNLGAKTFLSTRDFPDPVAGDARFFYFLTCQFNQFSLTRIYASSPYGSPYRDGVLYTWLIGGVGNTCSPFKLTNGLAFPGSDLSCSVGIS